jgi:hypothetical protein
MHLPFFLTAWRASRAAVFALVAAGLLSLTACDSADHGALTDATFQGAVTQDPGHAEEGTTGSGVEGATVTAVSVGATGQTTALGGQATTNAQGSYTLTVPGTVDAVVIEAQTATGRYAALVEAGAATGGTVRVPPMNVESTAEADVYVRARAHSQLVTAADVAAYVSAATAAAIRAGHTTVDQVAASVAAAVEAEAAFAGAQQGGNVSAQALANVRTQRAGAYATFRNQLAVATTAEARRTAVDAFESAYLTAFTAATLTARQQAQASIAGAGAAARFVGTTNVSAAFRTAQQARVFAAATAALAIEQEFRAAGASQARLDALAQARTTYLAAVRGATTAQALADAAAAYRAAVRTELAAQANIDASALDSAIAATANARTTLDVAVATATTAQAVAQAYAAFFAAARQAAATSLGAQAGFSAEVIALLSAF